MKTFDINNLGEELDQFLSEVRQGHHIVLKDAEKQVADVVPNPQPKTRGVLGSMKGLVVYDKGAFDPITDEEAKEWGL